ncbi:MAG: oligosaccharide flippase family protein [Bacteroidota bacterium]
MSIARKALIGAIWASGANYISQGIGFISLTVLGRLLLEQDFGLVATANSMIQFIFILSAFSFNLSIIQCQDDHDALYSTAFVLNIALSAVSLLLTVGSVVTYSFFRELSAVEIAVIFSLAIANIFNLFGQLFDAILQRNLEFKKTSAIAFFMNLINPLVAVVMAFYGAGVWSIVCGQIAAGLVFMLGGYYFAGWPISLRYNKETAQWFFKLGWRFLGSRALEVVYSELDRLVIKSRNSYVQVGIYDRAAMAARYPARVVTPAIINVALPVYSRLKADVRQLSDAYTLVNYFLIRTLLPFGLIFLLIPDYFMAGVLGEKWISAAPVLKVLAAYAVIHPMVENFRVLFYSLGRPEEVAKVRVIQIIVFIPVLFGLVAWMGITGAAWALLLSIVVTYVVFAWRAQNTITYPLLRTITIPIVISVLTAAIFFVLPVPAVDSHIVGLGLYSVLILAIFLSLEMVFEGKALLKHFAYFKGLLKNPSTNSEYHAGPDEDKRQDHHSETDNDR